MTNRLHKMVLFCSLIVLFSTQLFSATLAQESTLQQGRELFEKGQFAEALNFFDQGVDEKPTDGESHFWRAKCLSALDRGQESIAEYKLALLLSTDKAIKETCRAEITKSNEKIPVGSVVSEDAKADGKVFKLSTKKLDWNIKTDDNLQSSLSAQNAQLAAAVNGSNGLLNGILSGQFHGSGISKDRVSLEIREGVSHAPFQLTAGDMQTFKASDVYIVLDHSGSMESRDCPAGGGVAQSRLDWSIAELTGFSETLCKSLPHGFVFIPFHSSPQAFKISDSQQFSSYLRSLKGQGGTHLSPALNLAFRLHERHLNQPILIAVITDGLINFSDVKATISNATRRFRLPNGVFVTFAQVGVSVDTSMWEDKDGRLAPAFEKIRSDLDELNELDTTHGAAYKPCSIVRFKQLRKLGLGRALLRALRAYVPAPSENNEKKVETAK